MAPPAFAPPALALHDIRKSFDGFVALDGASVVVQPGQVHALLGENGAGKSTLMNIAAGLYQPDSGQVQIGGVVHSLAGPLDAARARIGMVHQHFKLVRPLSVAENVLLAVPPAGRKFRQALAEISARIAAQAAALGFAIDPARRVETLSIAEQQRVEILKALLAGARILILDEPTAVLTDAEAASLLSTMRALAAQHHPDGRAAVVLVTHKLADVLAYADTITVMRAGRTVAVADPAQTDAAALTRLVVGETAALPPRDAATPGVPRLTLRNLCCARADGHVTVPDLGLVVRAGEVYGLAGVGGNGQTELMEVLIGVRRAVSGQILVDGAGDVAQLPPDQRGGLALAAIPADRSATALAGALSVLENFAIAGLTGGRYGGMWRVNFAAMRIDAERAFATYAIAGLRGHRRRRLAQKAGLLSGGNAQKLVLAREFSRQPSLVVAHSPSRGLDARAGADVAARLVAAARQDRAAVLLISDDLDEILALSDRVGVINRGRIVAEFSAPVARQDVGQAMVGHA